jgi:hypothetical protein
MAMFKEGGTGTNSLLASAFSSYPGGTVVEIFSIP